MRGWGMGVTFGDYDNDGLVDIYLTYLGPNVLYRNNGNGTFTDVTEKAGVGDPAGRPPPVSATTTGTAISTCTSATTSRLTSTICRNLARACSAPTSARPVMCGPRGLPGDSDVLYRNNGDGTFTDVTQQSGAVDRDKLYGLGVVWADFDNDGDPDIYVANDDGPNLLFVNKGNGTFEEQGIVSGLAVSADGRNQGSMGIDAADYDNDGLLDAMVTNFAERLQHALPQRGRTCSSATSGRGSELVHGRVAARRAGGSCSPTSITTAGRTSSTSTAT